MGDPSRLAGGGAGTRTRALIVAGLLALALALAVGGEAMAWGPVGHRVVGQIASRQLSDDTRREVLALLDGASLAEASTWMDDVRDSPRYDWLEPLHYVNLDPRAGRFERCPERGCLVGALRDALDTLRDRGAPPVQRRQALRVVAHLVGDLHQPLHVSHRRDRGGNDIDVEWFGQPANLHWVWDTGLVRESGRWQELSERLGARLRDPVVAREAEGWRRGEVVAWTHESYRLTVEVVYPSAPEGSRLGRAYAARHVPVVERQLLVAAVRLAAVLESALP